MNKKFMSQALEVARNHCMKYEGGPFGAVVVKNGKVISEGWNTVTTDNDPTCHAEVNAIRKACNALKTFDLSGCEIYSTTEPCPMCLATIYWAKLSGLYFGNDRKDAAGIGFDDQFIYDEIARASEDRSLKTYGGVMAADVTKLFREWKKLPGIKMY
ncbi:tRNA-specific adenosine deaminase [Candidatus Peregrinibacteria bacterium RIFOXYB12_FULL_41_12]|nr:MAG: tRNA-specific adenosine deaminase [Candidatus Peregrinibacteria bacterium RIFOXYA2_FULL_41_18]OGJ49721.1 MAG: tRNA-specific adenosine deaminase [Candidatus Peregrinibacteria bacterium RIFOXYB12_FULL_41_12]OGJ52713.1 MAG: tRNA-specific adenosine deaminase [Candidatus Peregrinibacteria bacterium RIFOXYC2_FULL_41_22]OGJ54052.1 MAG: tRNA-specific adenosine deaminase [Candidatus Peregrinibacteria bacterium RIFOXYB2_FULL_41_88]